MYGEIRFLPDCDDIVLHIMFYVVYFTFWHLDILYMQKLHILRLVYVLYSSGIVRVIYSEQSLLTPSHMPCILVHTYTLTFFPSHFLLYHLCLTHTYSIRILCAFSVEVTWFILSKLLAGDTHASPHTQIPMFPALLFRSIDSYQSSMIFQTSFF